MILINCNTLDKADVVDVTDLNLAIEELAQRRLVNIDILDEPYRRSKIAWKVA